MSVKLLVQRTNQSMYSPENQQKFLSILYTLYLVWQIYHVPLIIVPIGVGLAYVILKDLAQRVAFFQKRKSLILWLLTLVITALILMFCAEPSYAWFLKRPQDFLTNMATQALAGGTSSTAANVIKIVNLVIDLMRFIGWGLLAVAAFQGWRQHDQGTPASPFVSVVGYGLAIVLILDLFSFIMFPAVTTTTG